MRILGIIGVLGCALLTVSCAAEPAYESHHDTASANTAPPPSATEAASSAAPDPVTDPIALVEAGAAEQCDAQGVAHYPDGFVAERTPEGTTAAWAGDQYQFGYPATAKIPGLTPDLPPSSTHVIVSCTLAFQNGRVVVTGWSAA